MKILRIMRTIKYNRKSRVPLSKIMPNIVLSKVFYLALRGRVELRQGRCEEHTNTFIKVF
jgi:hypothetical protein